MIEVISRADAKARGLKRYCTGEPCKRGHVAERRVSDCGCVVCGREKAASVEDRLRRKDYFREHQAKYRAANPDRVRATLRASYARHREKRVEEKRVERAVDPDLTRAILRRSYQKHKEQRSEDMRRYRAENPDRINALNRSYKARKRGAEGRYSVEDVERLVAAQAATCAGCAAPLAEGYHVDHIVPLTTGGSNWPDNIQLLCPTCNLSKGSKTMVQWIAQRRSTLEKV